MKSTLAIAFVIAALLLFSLILFQEPIIIFLGQEVFKQLLQFILIINLGGLVTSVYKQFERQKEDKNKRKEKENQRLKYIVSFLRDLSLQISKNYINLLKTIFDARATVFSCHLSEKKENFVLKDPYKVVIDKIHTILYELESIYLRAKSYPELFEDDMKLLDCLSNLPNYLILTIDEYEKNFYKFSKADKLSHNKFPHFLELLGYGAREYHGWETFKENYNYIISHIEKQLFANF